MSDAITDYVLLISYPASLDEHSINDTKKMTRKETRTRASRSPSCEIKSHVLTILFAGAIYGLCSSSNSSPAVIAVVEAFSPDSLVHTSTHRGRKTCIRMAGGDDERISEEEILAIGGDPFFLPDDESKAKATTEKNQQKRKQQPLLSSPRQQLLQTLDTQYQELGNQYKAIGETISALKKEFGVVDTADTEGERKKNNNSQTASEILSNTAIGSAAGMPSSSLLGSLGMLEDEIEEEKELTMEERKLEIEELGGDPFFLDDQAIDVKSEDDLPKSYENEDSSEKPTAPSEALSRMAMAGGDGETPSILSFLQDYHSPSEDEEEGRPREDGETICAAHQMQGRMSFSSN